jgi:lipase maturation factor 1
VRLPLSPRTSQARLEDVVRALGTYQENRWLVHFMVRLLEGRPEVLRLMGHNPFPESPPRYIRARVYLYRFTRSGERAWWSREERGLYFPPVSLK